MTGYINLRLLLSMSMALLFIPLYSNNGVKRDSLAHNFSLENQDLDYEIRILDSK